jgi:hypothetical protein
VRGLRDRLSDVLKNAARIQDDVAVPEAQNPETSALQVGIAFVIACAFRMLTAVSFHDEHVFKGDEINDPRSDW